MIVKSFSRAVGAALLTAALSYSASAPLLQAPPSATPDGEKTNERLKELDKPYMANEKALNEAGRTDLTKKENAAVAFDAIVSIYRRPIFRVHPEVASLIRGPIASMEAEYWSGKSKGVTEAELATTINDLATKLKMPPGALTTESQVRSTRLMAAASHPSFGARGITKQDGAHNDTMSPLQAMDTLLALINLKTSNPDFVVDPDVWEKNLKAHKHSDQWISQHTDGKDHTSEGRNESLQVWLQLENMHMSYVDGVNVAMTIMSSLGLQ